MPTKLLRIPGRAARLVTRKIFAKPPPSEPPPIQPPPRVIVTTRPPDTGATTIPHLAIAVTFHYRDSRLEYLRTIAAQFSTLAERVTVHVVTNVDKAESHRRIEEAVGAGGRFPLSIAVPALLGHPLLLTWCHFPIFQRLHKRDPSITHFLYVEDDILITRENIAYWLAGRAALAPHGFYPSFLRFEVRTADGARCSSDAWTRSRLSMQPRVTMGDTYAFVSLQHQYQGMYLLDRSLMTEHLRGPSYSPNFGPWSICEKAAQGLTFANVPEGFPSRNLVGFDLATGAVDPASLIHHLPGNYANNPQGALRDIRIEDLIELGGDKIYAG